MDTLNPFSFKEIKSKRINAEYQWLRENHYGVFRECVIRASAVTLNHRLDHGDADAAFSIEASLVSLACKLLEMPPISR